MQQQRLTVEQLRREAAIKRISVRQAILDIMVRIKIYLNDKKNIIFDLKTFFQRYVSDHQQDDYLMVGFSSQKANPFREKSSCSVL